MAEDNNASCARDSDGAPSRVAASHPLLPYRDNAFIILPLCFCQCLVSASRGRDAFPRRTKPSLHILPPRGPYLLPPSLAALHATRVRLLYPSHPLFSGTHCGGCGFPLTADNSQTRSIRKKRRKIKGRNPSTIRALWKFCRSCGHEEDVPLVAVRLPAFPKTRDRVRRTPNTHRAPHASNVATPSRLLAELSLPRSLSAEPSLSQPMASSSTPESPRPGSVTRPPSISPASSPSTIPRPQMQGVSSVRDQAKAKSRQKKKSRLQNILARNRERREQEKSEGGGQSTELSAFLRGL